jgi:hypothetical protein
MRRHEEHQIEAVKEAREKQMPIGKLPNLKRRKKDLKNFPLLFPLQ